VAEARVSVLVTAYEHERYVARALDGVLDQRGVPFEVLVGDDFWTSPGKLQPQVAHMDEHPGCAMCFLDVLCHYEDGPLSESLRVDPLDPRRAA
jgi:hypothetical protein